MWIEEKLALGTLSVEIFAVFEGDELSKRLANAGFGVTALDGHGSRSGQSPVYHHPPPRVGTSRKIIHEVNPKMFYSVEEVRASSEGVFHPGRRQQLMKNLI
ncbi:MAG: hypothetical protein IPO22_15265 [Anaerolineales bacterium]|nr:hypothetical protein [Anaerolineales bacterium]